MSTTVQPLSVKKLVEKKTRYRITYFDLRDLLYTLLGFTPEGDALKRLHKLANSAHESIAARNAALVVAAQEERASVPPLRDAQRNIAAFKRDMAPQLHIPAGAPNPFLESNRPDWASRDQDQDVLMTGDKVAARSSMSWRSEAISIPIFENYFGEWCSNGTFESARIMADVRRVVGESAPRIAFEYHGFKQVDGKVVPISGMNRYELSIEEAANLARGLLLLIDLATGASDEIAGA